MTRGCIWIVALLAFAAWVNSHSREWITGWAAVLSAVAVAALIIRSGRVIGASTPVASVSSARAYRVTTRHRKSNNPLRSWDQAVLAPPHEAGHAVAMTALGVKVTEMRVDGKGSGYTAYAQHLRRRKDLIATLAGPMAEAQFATRTAGHPIATRHALDLGMAYDHSDYAVVDGWGGLRSAQELRKWEQRTAKVLKGREGEIQAVAEALDKRGRLKGYQVRAAIRAGRKRGATSDLSGPSGPERKPSAWKTFTPKTPTPVAEESGSASSVAARGPWWNR